MQDAAHHFNFGGEVSILGGHGIDLFALTGDEEGSVNLGLVLLEGGRRIAINESELWVHQGEVIITALFLAPLAISEILWV